MKTKVLFLGCAGFVAGLCAIILLSSFSGQNDTPSYVTLNSYEFYGTDFESKIVIIYENDETETIKLNGSGKEKAIHANALKIHETINLLCHKGYKLVTSTKKGSDGSYIYEKK